MSVRFTIIGTCTASALTFIDIVGLQGFRNTIFKFKIILESVTCLMNDFKFTKFQTFTNKSVQSIFGDTRNILEIWQRYSKFQFWDGGNNRFLNKYIINQFRYTFPKEFCRINIFVKCFLSESFAQGKISDTYLRKANFINENSFL